VNCEAQLNRRPFLFAYGEQTVLRLFCRRQSLMSPFPHKTIVALKIEIHVLPGMNNDDLADAEAGKATTFYKSVRDSFYFPAENSPTCSVKIGC